jgi:DNA-binding CsgD family transcriptional regulator
MALSIPLISPHQPAMKMNPTAHAFADVSAWLDAPVALYAPSGRALHIAPVLLGMVSEPATASQYHVAAQSLVHSLCRGSQTWGLASPSPATMDLACGVRISAARLPASGAPEVIVVRAERIEAAQGAHPDGAGLTRREREVALLLAEGARNHVIAERLCISPHTARRHTERILGKLRVTSRAAVARRLDALR